MNKRNECHLCGTKLRGGYCVSCGFDVGRNRKAHYRLNESNAISSINGKSVHGKKIDFEVFAEKESTQLQNEKNKVLVQQIKPSTGKAEKSVGKIQKYQAVSPKVVHKEIKKRKKTPSCTGTVVKTMVIIFFIIIAVFNIFDNFSENTSYEEEYPISYESYETEVEEYDPYDMVTRELSEDGENFAITLNAGEYIVGIHIPEGNYVVNLGAGTGYFSVDDYENGIYLWGEFGEDEEYGEVQTMEDVRLYQNATFTISEGLVLDFKTESAQNGTISYILNPLTESIYLGMDDTIIAGTDFPAGVYDFSYVNAPVWVTYRIPANPDWYEEGYVEYYLWLDPNDSSERYNNVVLPEGTEVTADADLILMPSERISTMDYHLYYDYYLYNTL